MTLEITNNDAVLHTVVSGQQNQETIILLHGGPGVPEDMEPLISRLSNRYQVIYFHQRGTVNSPCSSSKYSMERYISDLDAVASHFRLQQFHLFGHSWGGLYAGIYADKNPERILSMFLSSPASGTGKQWIKMGWEVRRFNKKKSTFWEWVGMLRNSFVGTLGFDSGHRKFFRQFAINANKDYEVEKTAPLQVDLVRAKAVNRTNKSILTHEILKPLRSPHFPITITYGDDDIYGESKKYVENRYPTAKIVSIPDCSHMHWLHNPQIFYQVLDDHYDLS